MRVILAALVAPAAIPVPAAPLVPPKATAHLSDPGLRPRVAPRSPARPVRRWVPRVRRINKLIAYASPLIGLVMAPPDAAWADPWCAQWKNQEMCASVDDFQTFANRICLQAQAKENPTVDESITLHTDCQAAKNLARKAELAKTRQERAVAAQKELDALRR
ncbi:MAG: hypothetical protein ACJ8AH_15845 [Stellaceae bacterium]|jgi:hypothetical protein